MAKLGEICEILNGYAFKSENYTNEGVRIIRISNVQKGYIEDNTPAFYPCDDVNVAKYELFEGDLLISLTGNVGRVGLVDKKFLPAALNQRVACIRIKDSSTLYKLFLFNLLNNDSFERKCILSSKGVAQKNMSTEWLKNYEIPLPPLDEQRKIAAVLDKVSDLIAKRRQQLGKLDEMVKSRFVEMFGDPVLNQLGWKKSALETNATLLNGRAYKQEELLDSGKYPVLRVGNFFSNRGWYYSNLELDEDKYCDNGDLLYAWSASFGPQIWNGGKVIYHYHIWKILVGNTYNKLFLCKLLEYATQSLMTDTHGIAMMHLTKSGMEKTEFIVPPIHLQEMFATFVEQTEKTKTTINRSLEKLETLKKALMQKYFG